MAVALVCRLELNSISVRRYLAMLATKPELETAKLPAIKTALPGPVAQQVVAYDAQHISPSYTRPYPLVIKRAKGAMIEDVDGNLFLDFNAGVAVCSTGHAHPH